jgi:hypothetical protein
MVIVVVVVAVVVVVVAVVAMCSHQLNPDETRHLRRENVYLVSHGVPG